MAPKPALERARSSARLGLPPNKGVRFRLLRRVVVRLTWFTTRHQMDYNLAMLRAVEELRGELHTYQTRMSEVIASLEASLRSEILGADSREDRIERDVLALFATSSALKTRLDELAASLAADGGTIPDDEQADSSTPGARANVAHFPQLQSDRHQ